SRSYHSSTCYRQSRRTPHLASLFSPSLSCFFFNSPPPPAVYTLSLHDALPIYARLRRLSDVAGRVRDLDGASFGEAHAIDDPRRSEEHTSELQSLTNLVCRLLLEKKKAYEQGDRAGREHPTGSP